MGILIFGRVSGTCTSRSGVGLDLIKFQYQSVVKGAGACIFPAGFGLPLS